MTLPILTSYDVQNIIHECIVNGDPCAGGQKLVFPCIIEGKQYALKFMLASVSIDEGNYEGNDYENDTLIEVAERARREVEIMKVCDSYHLIKLGPIELEQTIYNGQKIIYFSEEWIEGWDLKTKLNSDRILEISEVSKLGEHLSYAIEELWRHSKIHRDIKPGNIVFSKNTGNYILLDMGFAFDLDDKSLTALGMVPGTVIYLSPEQINVAKKRDLDFRSDLFNLGIVMYEALTGVHPFYKMGMTQNQIIESILTTTPPKPSSLRGEITQNLDNIIMRLLAKQPHLRFRSCSQYREFLKQI